MGVVACTDSEKNDEKLLIATAANMQFAMEELTRSFTEETGIACENILASSGKLTAQIMAGAPYDVFVSADLSYPDTLYQAGFTKSTPKVYAYGHLVIWTRQDISLARLTSLDPSRVALANPQTAPYGKAAKETLEHLGLDSLWQGRLVFAESIAQVNQFISTGAVTFGFTAKSVVLAPDIDGLGKWAAIPDSLYSPIAQAVVVLRASEKKEKYADKFYEFLFSDRAKEILHKFGYTASEE